jgi:O-antigen/teichoic acid export membrane protein
LDFLFYSLAGTVSPLVQGIGVPHYQRNAEIVSLVLNVAFSLVLIKRYGFYGAPVGTAMAISISSTYYLWSFHRYMGRPLLAFVQATFWKPVMCSLAAGVVAAAVIHFLGPLASGSRVLSTCCWPASPD